jgi:CRISPR/Cas system CSM-associated protein Csm4 (group 5 of RAMP superfamily)
VSILFYIIGYIVLSIAVAYFLKNRKDRAKEISGYSKAKQVANNIYDRKKHNDYMNNPKFSYMSCNKHNPESSFYKNQKIYKNEESQLYILLKQAEYESIRNPNNCISNEGISSQIVKSSMGSPSYYAYN